MNFNINIHDKSMMSENLDSFTFIGLNDIINS